MMKLKTRWGVLLVVLAFGAAACGGSNSEGGGEDGVETTLAPNPASSSTPSEDEPASSEEAPSNSDPDEVGLNQAVVTMEGESFEFHAAPEGVITDCNPDFFGIFWVIGEGADGSTFSLSLPLEADGAGTDPPSVRIKNATTGSDLTADATIIETANYADVISEGQSQVDDYTIDGSSVSGTATFIDEDAIFAALGGTGANPEPVVGSFSVTCEG